MAIDLGATALEAIAAQRILPVIRARSADDALFGAELLIGSGFDTIEIALTTPDALTVVTELARRGHCVGVGSVLTETDALEALAAGAQFMVSPCLLESVYRLGVAEGVLVIPGALTPSEVATALGWGARVVKLFPIVSVGGVRHVKLLRDPFPGLQAIPTGGVALAEVADYLAAGAIALGVGSQLAHPEWLEKRDDATIRAAAHSWLAALPRVSNTPFS